MQVQGSWLWTHVPSLLQHLWTGDVTVLVLSIHLKGHCGREVEAWREDGRVFSALGSWPWMRQHTLSRAGGQCCL